MGKLTHFESSRLAVETKTDSNPEGKGCNGFLLDWNESEPEDVAAKPRRQVLAEFFTSMLVLSATFKFRPAIGTPSYLYWIDGKWSLSLVAPEEWSDERRAAFAGTCMLQRDMTWTIAPSDRLADNQQLADAMRRFYEAFTRILSTNRTLEEILPFHAGRLPYFQRLHASALSRSLRASVTLGDQASISCKEWRMLLPQKGQAPLALES